MQCRDCGYEVTAPAPFCPSCGARLVAAEPGASAPRGGVASPAGFLGPDATQAQPIVPEAVRPPRPAASGAPQPGPRPAVPAQAAQAAAAAPAAPAAPARSPGLRPGDTIDGRWRLEKFLGQGSLCNAYLCRDLRAGNREVVLKAMHSRKASEPGLAEGFLQLAESVSRYDHRGIARIHESGRINGTPFYSMEWVSGTPLRLWLLERLSFENRVLPGLRILRSLLDTFEAIHERGCYGCLKPENVFVTLSGPVVTDFGVVGFLTPQEFEFNAYARRYLPYMAPEVRQDWSNLIPHSDYYSLGAILYEILAGRAPSSPLRLPSELSDLFGIEADEIILKAMAPKPLDRFGTLEAFRAAVDALQAALLSVPGPSQPGEEGSRTLQAASGLTELQGPESGFQASAGFPPAGEPAPDAGYAPADSGSPAALNGHAWSPDPGLAPSLVPATDAPSAELVPAPPEETGEGRIRSAFAGLGEGGTAQAHANRRFARSPKDAFPEGTLPSVPGTPSGVAVPENALAAATAQGGLPAAGAWEGPSAASLQEGVPEGTAPGEPVEEPIPAWLWIAIALAGCCMVVLSAYFGLLLPR